MPIYLTITEMSKLYQRFAVGLAFFVLFISLALGDIEPVETNWVIESTTGNIGSVKSTPVKADKESVGSTTTIKANTTSGKSTAAKDDINSEKSTTDKEANTKLVEPTTVRDIANTESVKKSTLKDRRPKVSDNVVLSAVKEARRVVNRAVNETVTALFSRNRTSSLNHKELLRINRYPSKEARDLAKTAEVYERALAIIKHNVESDGKFNTTNAFSYEDILTPKQLELIANVSGCTIPHMPTPDCSDRNFHSRFRTFTGACNNFQNPLWGTAFIRYRRVLGPIYEDGFNIPRGWNPDLLYNGFRLPSARLVSARVIRTRDVTSDPDSTLMLMQWGQFLDHDLDLALPSTSMESFSKFLDCTTTCDYLPPCFPIAVPANDTRIRNFRCLDFTRNSASCGSLRPSSNLLPREQINELTSYIDASQVYGSGDREANALRDLTNNRGRLREGPRIRGNGPLMPFQTSEFPVDCQRAQQDRSVDCFLSGDIRANEIVSLLVMHTLWFREHNRVADELKRINPQWDGDRTYHEARKIIGAQMQHITYQHWLPIIIGQQGMNMLGQYQGYNAQLDATISNVFATAALRMGHGLIQPEIMRLDAKFRPIPQGNLRLDQAFFSPSRMVNQGGTDPVLRGLFGGPAKLKLANQMVNTNLTESLFRSAEQDLMRDLVSLNIQRGRDHGLPGYNEWRRFCNLRRANSFDDFQQEIRSRDLRNGLRDLYGHPDNVDVWVGGMAEDTLDGAKVGPTFRCILIEQFRRLRDGDRFWYENPGVFTPAQLAQLRRTTLGRVICDSGDSIERVTGNVFRRPEKQTPQTLSCNAVPRVDFEAWRVSSADLASSNLTNTTSAA